MLPRQPTGRWRYLIIFAFAHLTSSPALTYGRNPGNLLGWRSQKWVAVLNIVDQIDALRETITKLSNSAEILVEEEAEKALEGMAKAEFKACLLGGGPGGIAVTAYCRDYEGLFWEEGGFMPLGSLDEMIAGETETIAQGDVAWGEQLRAALVNAIQEIDAALVEGRKQLA